jgi:hypothetical protein
VFGLDKQGPEEGKKSFESVKIWANVFLGSFERSRQVEACRFGIGFAKANLRTVFLISKKMKGINYLKSHNKTILIK